MDINKLNISKKKKKKTIRAQRDSTLGINILQQEMNMMHAALDVQI